MVRRKIVMLFGLALLCGCLVYNVFILSAATVKMNLKGAELLKTNASTSQRLKLIILTYMRSGSSLTGDIVQQHPDVFYVFEPLKTLGRKFEGLIKDPLIHYSDNTSINASWTGEGRPPLYIQTLKSVFQCRFDQLDNATLKQNHMAESKSTIPAFKCIEETKSSKSDWQNLLMCFNAVSSKCQAVNIIAVKCIRLSMLQAQVLMSSDPNVKIIHLIRDPRGVIKSRQTFIQFKSQTYEDQANKLCSQIMEDINVSKSISKIMPYRILTVRYEDIVESPIAASRQLYAFLNLEMSSDIENYIWNITYAHHGDGSAIRTVRYNATETAFAWRRTLDYKSISAIEKSCTPLLNRMGYYSFQSEDEVLNFSISLKYSTYDSDLMKVVV